MFLAKASCLESDGNALYKLSCGLTQNVVSGMTVINLSFGACGFLGIYHLGAVRAFVHHGEKLLGSVKACAGASAGALVAAVLITAPDKIQRCKEFTYSFADDVRQQRFGVLTPGHNFMLTLREGIDEILPGDAHSLASNRLHVAITHATSGKNHIISKFASREELIKKWIDGGFTDCLPLLPVGRTITVSPFAGLQDVCPAHRGHFNRYLRLPNMNIMLSMENIKRLSQALFPPDSAAMHSLCQEGFDDAVKFLKKEAWMS
ncbi:patatin-like phospholipase domain-containing protein 4 isoform X2 [Thalassophryne amazonica]|uniref:patatin-like phospholipase domain-containing protein 4 isoform X2 n=1 Tax=Thalassophryne amazonica TaxID=390379 RepID=UPI0014713A2A|nr:patatin-like phospholipase domain-containing protein 4 isoform X2 [Thalassophryne amazonica]